MRKSLGAAESNVADSATKAYVDGYTAARSGYTPPSGSWQMPGNPLVTVDTGAMVSGSLFFMPYDIGPLPMTIDALGISVTTALVAGTTTTSVGLYKDDGSGGYPDTTSGGRIGSGTLTLTSTGIKTVTVSATLAPGRYWTGFLYVQTVAPTTAAVVSRASAAGNLWQLGSATSWTHARGLVLTSQTVLPTTQVSALAPNVNQSVLVGIRRA